MKIETYLKSFNKNHHIILIGPLYKRGLFHFEEPLIYVDGGVNFKEEIGVEGFCAGDGDSSNSLPQDLIPKEKDYSDLEYVLSKLPPNITTVLALGFLGGRKDHESANLSSFYYYLENSLTHVDLGEGYELYGPGEQDLKIYGGFSVINSGVGHMKISGEVKYPYNGKIHRRYSSQFISNIGHGQVKIVNTMPIGLYRYDSNL